MRNLQIFRNEEFGEVRTVIAPSGEPHFVGKDICIALGYKNPSIALQDNVDAEDKGVTKVSTLGGEQDTIVINESGLYALVFGSRLPTAKKFKRWVTSEVLPSIRETGTYNKPLTPQEIMREQLAMIDNVSERVDKLENTMTIDYGQQKVLERLVGQTVIASLGGKDTMAYKEMSKKVFKECNRDIQDRFNVNSRSNVPKLKFEDACKYIRHWEPCTNTKIAIAECNNQMCLA